MSQCWQSWSFVTSCLHPRMPNCLGVVSQKNRCSMRWRPAKRSVLGSPWCHVVSKASSWTQRTMGLAIIRMNTRKQCAEGVTCLTWDVKLSTSPLGPNDSSQAISTRLSTSISKLSLSLNFWQHGSYYSLIDMSSHWQLTIMHLAPTQSLQMSFGTNRE